MTGALDKAVVSAGNLRGMFWMLVATVCLALMHVSIRHVSQQVHPFEIAFFRTVFGLLAVVPWFIRLGWQPLRTKRLGLLGGRALLNIVSMLAFFTALSMTPVADATALTFTAPLFATVLAVFVFGETIGLKRAGAIAVGFLGTLVVLRPTFAVIDTGQLLALMSAFVWGGCMIIVKQLGRTESSVTITLYMSLFMAPLALVPALFVWSWPGIEQLAWLAWIGVIGSFGQMAMAEGLKSGQTHVVMPVDFAKLIWVAIIGYLAFGEVPDIFVWIGGIMIFTATAAIAYRENILGVVGKESSGPS